MHRIFLILGLLALSLVVAGGGHRVGDTGTGPATGGSSTTSSGTPGNDFSCDFKISTMEICAEYDNLPAADLSAEASACTGENGTVGTGCSSTNRLGTCSLAAGGVTADEAFYSDGGLSAATAQMSCTSGGGTWTPG